MRRLRWRLKGALQWPLFVVLTLVDAVLLMVLPIAGTGPGLAYALLLAMFLNLGAVAGFGRLLAWWLGRRRPDVPRVVAEDRAGVALLCLVTVLIVAGGIVHAPGAGEQQRARDAQREAVRTYVLAYADPVYRDHLGAMDVEQHGDEFFRTCVPGDPAHDVPPLCLLVDTAVDPPRVSVDADRSPNRPS